MNCTGASAVRSGEAASTPTTYGWDAGATGVTAVLPGILTGGDGVDSLSPSEAELEALGFNVIRFEN